jgi:hypothetical protein
MLLSIDKAKELLDMLREAGVHSAKLSETGNVLEVTFAPTVPPFEPPDEQPPPKHSPLKKSARALLAPMQREDERG